MFLNNNKEVLKNVKNIIWEEINNFFSDWHVYDDDYTHTKNTTDYLANIEKYITDEKFGYFIIARKDRAYKVNVYKNPQDITYFPDSVRGILTNQLDFYLALNPAIFHTELIEFLMQKNVIPNIQGIQYTYHKVYPKEFVAVVRYGKNIFGQSGVYDDFPLYYKEMFSEANKKFLYQFKYWR